MPDPQCQHFLEQPDNPWTCMSSDQLNDGCAIYCRACRGSGGYGAPVDTGTKVHAKRWCRPSEDLESRNGNGTWTSPRAGHPSEATILMPLEGANVEIAQCWRNFGVERFKEGGAFVTLCQCGAGTNPCGIKIGYLDGNLATCWLFYGWGWPPDGFYCTGALSGNTPFKGRFWSAGLLNAGLIYLGSYGEGGLGEGENICTVNAAVTAWGHIEQGSGGECFPDDVSPDQYFAQSLRNAFNWMYVVGFDIRWGGGRTEDALKNAATQMIKDDMAGPDSLGFNQVDSARRGQNDSVNVNYALSSFGRGWNGSTAGDGYEQDVPYAADTGVIEPFGNDVDHGYPGGERRQTFTSTQSEPMPAAVSQVTVNVRGLYHRDHPIKGIRMTINGQLYGGDNILPNQAIVGPGEDCVESSHTFTITADEWNSAVPEPDLVADPDAVRTFELSLSPLAFNSDDCPNAIAFVQVDISFVGEEHVEGPRPLETLPFIVSLVGRLRKTGHTINCEYVLVDVSHSVNVVLHRVNTSPPLEPGSAAERLGFHPLYTTRFYYHGAVRIAATDLEAFNAAGYTLDGNAVHLENVYTSARRTPRVIGDIDTIDWYYEGDYVRPPWRGVWRARLGHLTEPPAPRSIGTGICDISDWLQNLNVPAEMSYRNADPGERHKAWLGSVTYSMNGDGC